MESSPAFGFNGAVVIFSLQCLQTFLTVNPWFYNRVNISYHGISVWP